MTTATHFVIPARQRAISAGSSQPDRARRTAELFAEVRAAPPGHDTKPLLDEVAQVNMGVASAIAARYRNRGLPLEDLEQVAFLALVKAVRGYDADTGRDFLAYAVPTIRGEIKRHFRDFGWTVRPPRRIQELQARISSVTAELTSSLGRAPRPSEVAERLDVSLEDVHEALATDGCFTPASLDRPVGETGDSTVADLLGEDESGQGAAEARVMLGPAIRRLGERDRHIVMLRFFRGWTQQEIADDIGVTQMQVSRLLARILADLRQQVGRLDDTG